MVISDKTYTLAEFEELAVANPDLLLELIDGRIVEKVTSEEHGSLAGNIIAALIRWKRENKIQGYYSLEASVELPDVDKNHRRPDVSFRLTDGDISKKGALNRVPDFCVEIRSPSNTPKELREKAEFFLANGARLVWLVHPRKRVVEIYLGDGSFDICTEDDVLSGGDVLPGFEMPVKEIFEV